MISPLLQQVQARVGKHMDAILGEFEPRGLITVAVRHPGLPERDFLMTNDDLAEVAKLIERRQSAGPQS